MKTIPRSIPEPGSAALTALTGEGWFQRRTRRKRTRLSPSR